MYWAIEEDGNVCVEVTVPFGGSAVIELPFYNGKIQEVGPGKYEFHYLPTRDLRCKYTKKTLFKDMMNDERATEIIGRISPLLQHFLGTGDEDFLNESLQTLSGMAYLGFREEEIKALSDELTTLKEA